MIKKNTNNCDFENDNYDYAKNVEIKNKEVKIPKIYKINFFHYFDSDVAKYKPYFDVFERAQEDDEIVIYFQSGGGSVSTLNMFLNAMKTCKCKNITAKVNYAASAAAIMTLACNNIIFNENSTLMLHTYSSFYFGKSQEIEADKKHSDLMCKKIIDKYCKKILSDQEIEQMHNGKDFYFDENEAINRLKKYTNKNRKNKKKK